jgi:hypothetical protein
VLVIYYCSKVFKVFNDSYGSKQSLYNLLLTDKASSLLQNSCAYDLTMFLYIICKHFIQAKKDIEVIGNRVLHLISVGPICSTENIALKQRGGLVGA